MTDKKIVFENYGLNPPQKASPFWGITNYPTEDDVIFSVDLQASLQKLNPTEKEILTLSSQGYSKREIADMIDLPDTTVQDIKSKAIKKLKEMMNGEDNLCSLFATDTISD